MVEEGKKYFLRRIGRPFGEWKSMENDGASSKRKLSKSGSFSHSHQQLHLLRPIRHGWRHILPQDSLPIKKSHQRLFERKRNKR